MAEIVLRPDLKTAGGEVNDILFKGRFVGTLLLVYRENDRVCGSVQLEKESLSSKDKKEVVRYVTDYVQSTIHAIKAADCDVLVTHSSYDHVIATDADQWSDWEEDGILVHDEPEVIWVTDEDTLGDWDVSDRDTVEMDRTVNRYNQDPEDDRHYRNPVYYELVSTKESRSKMEYHVYDKNQEWVAEVFLRIIGPDVVGDIHWVFNPLDEEIEHVTDLVVSDFDSEAIDTFTIDHRFEGQIIETIELTHEDLLDDSLDLDGRDRIAGTPDELEEYTVVLARDDQDMLTYEIYKQREGGLPIGTATVDISRKQLSGFIDFRSKMSEPGEREKIATLVMQELDKEKDYNTISFTMLQHNKPIDEIVFENEPVH
ncbi:hypothetical protein [Gorillibacterium sp. sgz5001074]|uniref:hypothetical protein n=1 Tax=Gorillibacterium sp. sgz5001074 TaxID=3446695 RepID=UPI003F6655F1